MKILKSIFTLTLALLAFGNLQAQKVFANDGVAIAGYDVVAYHTEYKALKGSADYSTTHEGAIYHFSSAENKAAFEAEPTKYLPQYGGYCAFAMANMNKTVPVNPETFKIRDGKLYLFFNDLYEGKPFNTIVPWNGNEAEFVTKADANWAKQN